MTPRPNWLTKDRLTQLQQVWAQAQACWPLAPLPVQWLATESAHTATGLWTDLNHREVHIHGPTFLTMLNTHGLKAYGFVFLAQQMGYAYLQPGSARFAGSLQLQARRFFKAQGHPDPQWADQYVQYFLDIGIHQPLHQRGVPLASMYRRHQPSLPFWILRLYEQLWKLPENDLCRGRTLSEPEAASAHLAAQLWQSPSWPAESPIQRMHKQLQQFLGYALPHLQSSQPIPYTGLVMQVDQPLGVSLSAPHTTSPLQEDNGTSPLDPVAGKHSVLSPLALTTLLPHCAASALISQYYTQRAWPHLFTLPQHKPPPTLYPEGQQLWHMDEPIQQLHWQASLQQSPTVIPGFTTRQYPPVSEDPSALPGQGPTVLTLFIDASQSMPNPQETLSLAVLQGFVWMLSALQQRLDVQVVNWAEDLKHTPYTQNRALLSEALLQVPAGATHFPWDDYLHTPAQGVVVLLSDLGLLQALQGICRNDADHCKRLNTHALTYCFLDLPFESPLQQQSLAELQQHLPRWHFALLADLP